jgi:phytoene dehydrogenase-like protein
MTHDLRMTTGYNKARYDAVVVGAGPNGLAAAITLARAGRSVLVVEANSDIGGGTRSAELTLPGFVHDVCSAIHPLGVTSPFFRAQPLNKFGLGWVQPPACMAHPLDDGSAVLLYRSLEKTAQGLGSDGAAYRRMLFPIVRNWRKIERYVLGPLRLPLRPDRLLALSWFGLCALPPARLVASVAFKGERARALWAGTAAHSMLPFDRPASSAAAVLLTTMAHVAGWPMARGGSQQIANAMSAYLQSLGGEIQTDTRIEAIGELPVSDAVLFDVTPRQLLRIAGDALPDCYRRQLKRFRYGSGVFKIDYALDGPVPWRAEECKQAATLHLGGTLEEIARGESQVGKGIPAERPFVLAAQQSLFDPTRAPAGKHTFWAYCHVPNGSTFDMTARIEAQIERFAPGFRDRVLARHITSPAQMQAHDANYIGGDINGGVQDLLQLFARPTPSFTPYRTPAKGIYICSSSTPPGGGVHGMCGLHAARAALHDIT